MINAFNLRQAASLTGLSRHMVNYLVREGYLAPAYDGDGVRGSVRYFSYRDLVVLRLVKDLLRSGIEIRRLKRAIARLAAENWTGGDPTKAIRLIATDGRRLYFPNPDGNLTDLTAGQKAFAFVLDMDHAQRRVRGRLKGEALQMFTLENRPLADRIPKVKQR